jgi:ribose transport system substrate-binding protein
MKFKGNDKHSRVSAWRLRMAMVGGLVTVFAASLFVALGSTASAHGTSAHSSSTKGLTIGEILLSPGAYQVAHAADFTSYAKTLGMTVKTCDANGTVSGQQTCVDEMISSHVAGFVMQPQSPSEGTAAVKQAQAAGIPVVTWAVGPVVGVQAPFLQLDEYPQSKAAGVTAGKWVEAHFHQTPAVVEVTIPGNTNCTNRMSGFLAGLKSVNKATTLVADPNGQGAELPSENAMANVIQSGKKFNIATGCNGDSEVGVLDALKAAGRGQAVNKVPKTEYVWGVDGITQQIQELLNKNSPLMQVLGLDPVTNSKALVNALVKYIHHQIPSTYRGNLFDTVINPTCKSGQGFLKADYGQTVACNL